ncbi:probable prolyl 4-hydroxylase 12 isoform X2 [Rosa rugosa]|uniref:probable prolyl 4-hydroxylase 12 isoform X2 n=1 Tax=Rosa rugosa TaxID=74645 RepID=UPI002B40ACB3|nr:probable prolyl 4-hydroxylase 12 isoform X2 [Rosa rugosa]
MKIFLKFCCLFSSSSCSESSMASSLLSIFLLLPIFSISSCSAETRKELRSKEFNQEALIQLGHSVDYNRIDPSRVVQLSWRPRVFLYKGFLSDEECDHLISLANGGEEKSSTEYDEAGNSNTNRMLKSLDLPLSTEDGIVSKIEEKISAWTFLPKENSRALQVLHYDLEEAEKNYNYFGNKSTLEQSEPLLATVILYLSNVTRGGEILFPESELKSNAQSGCGKSSSILKPTKGNAILFFNLHPNASPDKSSSHARCPVLEGEMWCATKFLHAKAIPRENSSSNSDGSDCTDEDDSCPRWADIGECQRNPVFMIGSDDYYGTCRKSCNAC